MANSVNDRITFGKNLFSISYQRRNHHMNTTTFLILLSVFASLSSLVTEGVKHIATDKANLPYNLLTITSALIVGSVGTAVYYYLNAIPFTVSNILCMILMGLAGGLASMVGFDKIRQALEQVSEAKR